MFSGKPRRLNVPAHADNDDLVGGKRGLDLGDDIGMIAKNLGPDCRVQIGFGKYWSWHGRPLEMYQPLLNHIRRRMAIRALGDDWRGIEG